MTALFAPVYDQAPTDFGWHVQAPDQPGRIRIDDAPPGGPQRALRCELQPGDRNPVGNTSRAEVYALHASPSTLPAEQWPLAPGTTVKFTFIYHLQAPWPVVTDGMWLVLSQLKGLKGGSPPISLEAYKSKLRLNVTGKGYDLGPLPIGRWLTVEFLVHFSLTGAGSADPGWFHVPGIIGRTERPTMDLYSGKPDPVYVKQGLYRSTAWDALGATHVAFFGAPLIDPVP